LSNNAMDLMIKICDLDASEHELGRSPRRGGSISEHEVDDLDLTSRQIAYICERGREICDLIPRDGQVQVIHQLVYQKRDTIVLAAAGWGKSLPYQLAPLIDDASEGAALIIMPLQTLEHEQCQYVSNFRGGRGFVLDGVVIIL